MPTLPLYDTPGNVDAWHRVRAPGGYEWWHFEATSGDSDVRVVIDFFDGDPFNAAYQRAYSNYRRRPTRVAPPVPRDYPCVRIQTFQTGKRVSLIDAPQPPGSLVASDDGMEIRIGPNVIRSDGGAFQLSLESAEFTFRPLEPHPPSVRELAGEERSAIHFRIIPCGSYDVSGTLRLGRETPFAGRGTYVHYFGTGPIGNTDVY